MIFMYDVFFTQQGYEVNTDKKQLQTTEIFRFLTEEAYWAEGLTLDKLQKAIEGSLCFGLYHRNQQVGFARVVTDYVSLAYICDVYVLKTHRKKGLSKWLVQHILNNEALGSVRRLMLATADAHGLYAQFGFNALDHPEYFMSIFKPYSQD